MKSAGTNSSAARADESLRRILSKCSALHLSSATTARSQAVRPVLEFIDHGFVDAECSLRRDVEHDGGDNEDPPGGQPLLVACGAGQLLGDRPELARAGRFPPEKLPHGVFDVGRATGSADPVREGSLVGSSSSCGGAPMTRM